MALMTQLVPGSDLFRWCQETFPGTGALVARVISAARVAEAPVRPYGRVGGQHRAEVAAAFGRRLADLVEPAPPYAALLGEQGVRQFGRRVAGEALWLCRWMWLRSGGWHVLYSLSCAGRELAQQRLTTRPGSRSSVGVSGLTRLSRDGCSPRRLRRLDDVGSGRRNLCLGDGRLGEVPVVGPVRRCGSSQRDDVKDCESCFACDG